MIAVFVFSPDCNIPTGPCAYGFTCPTCSRWQFRPFPAEKFEPIKQSGWYPVIDAPALSGIALMFASAPPQVQVQFHELSEDERSLAADFALELSRIRYPIELLP